MTRITHTQAGRYMRADLDGLLTAAQRRDLTAHLDECEACRLESESLALLTARLKSDFRARWDTQHGPSKNVMANVQSQSRRIIMSNRINTGLKIFAGLTALILLGFLFNPFFKQLQEFSEKNNSVPNSALSGNGNNNTDLLTIQQAQALAGFDVLVPSYLPEGYTFEGATYDSQIQEVTLKYILSSSDPNKSGVISIYQILGDFPKAFSPPPYTTPVPIRDVTGKFTHGVWVYDAPNITTPRWEGDNDYYALSWQKDGMSYMVDFLGGVLTPPVQLDDLTAIAESLKSAPTDTAQQIPSIATDKFNGEWIAFISGEYVSVGNEKLDVYMIHPDGTGLINLTNSPAYYYYLQWSPNGANFAFLRTSNTTEIMGANQNGTYLITATNFDSSNIHGPLYSWSPNSEQIAFIDNRSGNYDIYTLYADGRNETQLRQLTNDPGQDGGFVWSPDGGQIAFQRLDGENLSVYIMNADGSNQREVARGSGKVKLRWSLDGKSIYASSTVNSWLECEACVAKPAVYQIDLDGQSVHQLYAEQDASKVSAWYLYDTPQNTLYFMRIDPPAFVEFWGSWMQAEGNSIHEIGSMDPQQTCKSTTGNSLNEHISPNERFSVISNYCAGGFDLYLADHEATIPEQKLSHLLGLPLSTYGQGGDNAYLPISWSPDGRWLIYDNGQAALYLLNVERAIQDPNIEPSLLFESGVYSAFEVAWQPALANNIVEEEPTQTDNRLLAFSPQQTSNSEIYTVHADGSDLKNITNNSAQDANPFWSPDGKRIAFQSDRNGGYYSQIFLMDADGSNIVQLTTDKGEHILPFNVDGKTNPWSPDGSKLLFLRRGLSETEWILQAIDINSGNTTSFVTGRISFNDVSWSPNGEYIGFILNDPKNTELDKFVSQIHIVSADASDLININSLLPADETLGWQSTFDWSHDGQSIFFVATNVDYIAQNGLGGDNNNVYNWKAYEVRLADRTLVANATTHSPIGGWWQGNYFVTPVIEQGWTWIHTNGVTTVNPFRNCEDPSGGGAYYQQSSNGNVVIGTRCSNFDWWLYWVNPNGTMVSLIDSPIQTAQADMQNLTWSRDDKFIAFNIVLNNKIDMYIVNVTESTKNPSLPPVQVPVGYSQLNLSPAWQPVP